MSPEPTKTRISYTEIVYYSAILSEVLLENQTGWSVKTQKEIWLEIQQGKRKVLQAINLFQFRPSKQELEKIILELKLQESQHGTLNSRLYILCLHYFFEFIENLNANPLPYEEILIQIFTLVNNAFAREFKFFANKNKESSELQRKTIIEEIGFIIENHYNGNLEIENRENAVLRAWMLMPELKQCWRLKVGLLRMFLELESPKLKSSEEKFIPIPGGIIQGLDF